MLLSNHRQTLFLPPHLSSQQRTQAPRRQVFLALGLRPGHQRARQLQQHSQGMARAAPADGDAELSAQGSAEAAVSVPHTTEVLTVKASAASSVATMINVAVGAGVLSLPFAFSCTGWALGLALTGAARAAQGFQLCTPLAP